MSSPCHDALDLRAAAARPEEFPAAARANPVRRRLELALVAMAMVLVIAFYGWTVAANSGFDSWGDLDYYQLLVRGWRKGQLHLDKAPSPALLALADPYDPAHNTAHKLGDATLFAGKYYLYFGAVPAATLMLPFNVITGREMTMGAAVFVFCSVAFVAASGLWLAIRRRYFSDSAIVMAPLGVLAIGFGTHLLAMAQRPMIWELPISGGIAFTMLAAGASYVAVHSRRPRAAMAAAGLFLGLAVGSRPTCLFAAPLLLPPLWLAWRERTPQRSWWKMAVAALVPLGACGVAIMAHNHARFENPFEFGQNYQLSGAYEGKLTHFSGRFLPHNLAVYFFQPLRWESEFPFARAEIIEFHDVEDYFGSEEVAGLAVTFPFFWFLAALPLAWWKRQGSDAMRFTVSLGCLAGYAIPVMGLLLCYFSTTMRYEADFAVVLGVLALVGMLAGERWAAQWRCGRGVALALAGLLIVATVVVGTLVSFDYHNRSMHVTDPSRWQALTTGLHRRLAEVGRWFGNVEGPRVLKVRFTPRPKGTSETFWEPADPAARERVLVGHVGDHLIRFGYAREGMPVKWGRPLRWESNHTHTVEVQVPSLYPPIGDNWWGGARRVHEFRERTSVAVWFSGGRALEAVVEPLPAGLAPGGRVGTDFSGEVRKMSNRLYRDDELPTGLAEPWAKRGGVLRMRVVFPQRMREAGEPLFATGAHYRSSIIFVQPAAGGMKFVFENYTQPRVESPVVRPDPRGHMVELEMPSFRPEAFGEEAEGDVVVRLDGRELMRTRQVAYPSPWGDEQIGRNPFGTTCEAEFRGWILDARWSAAGVR